MHWNDAKGYHGDKTGANDLEHQWKPINYFYFTLYRPPPRPYAKWTSNLHTKSMVPYLPTEIPDL
jgi:hypothetical protein